MKRPGGFFSGRQGANLALAASLALAGLLPAALSPGDSTAGPSTAHAPAARIVSLAPSLTESLVYLGARDRLVGRTRFCVWPRGGLDDVAVVGGMADPSLESLLTLKPDLVVATTMTPRPVVQRLESLGLRVEVLPQLGLDAVVSDLQTLAGFAGVDATTQLGALRARFAAVQSALATLRDDGRPGVLVLYGFESLHSAGGGTFPDAIIAAAGGRNVVTAANSMWPTLALEQVAAWDPAVILVTADHLEDEAAVRAAIDELPRKPVWSDMRAVRDGRVILVGDSLLSIPGPRTIEAIERLARVLHPERFPAARAGKP